MHPIVAKIITFSGSLFNLVMGVALAVLLTAPVGEPGLVLRADREHLQSGEVVTVQVMVENAPPIYGAEIHLVFDPQFLEVLDANPDQPEIQLIPGDFLKLEQSAFLQNQANNQGGKLDYTQALINPAPPVQGSGCLFSIKFRAKANGSTKITINANSLFGTQSGQTIAPARRELELQVSPGTSASKIENTPAAPGADAPPRPTPQAQSASASTAPAASGPDSSPDWGTWALLGTAAVTVAGGLWWAMQRNGIR